MNNRTLWTIVGVVLLVVIGLLVFGVISIPMKDVTEQTTNTSTTAELAAAENRCEMFIDFEQPAPAYSYAM